MGESNGDWLRVRGIGRERFAGYLADYLGTLGYAVERSESTEPSESHLKGRLERMNPAVPARRERARVPLLSHERRRGGSVGGSDRRSERRPRPDGPSHA